MHDLIYSPNLFYALDLFGVAVFALSGGLAAARKRLDLFGFMVVAMAPAIGGGSLRDLLLGIRPVFWISDPNYVAICLVMAVSCFFLAHLLQSRFKALVVADAFGLALFTIMGIQRALETGVGFLIALVMGVMTAVAGGIVRDVLCGEIPLVLRREIYATASVAGGLGYLLMLQFGLPGTSAVGVSFVITLGIRLLAIKKGLSLPIYGKDQEG